LRRQVVRRLGSIPSHCGPSNWCILWDTRHVKRGLLKTQLGDINVALLSEFFADVVALMICTPADALAIQLQTATGKEAQESKAGTEEERAAIKLEKVGDWFIESIEHLPAVILTDLPYLLSRIALNQVLI